MDAWRLGGARSTPTSARNQDLLAILKVEANHDGIDAARSPPAERAHGGKTRKGRKERRKERRKGGREEGRKGGDR
eukprot:scaffold1199_cov265-Pinguiococcus_pyrenoidosus.AAC.10